MKATLLKLMMFFQLLLLTCAYALGAAAEVPPYTNIDNSIRAAVHLLEENVLSMDGNPPLLNDPRRQYADIIYVVISEASNFPLDSYYGNYQKNINESLPFAVTHPETVIQIINETIDEVAHHIKPIQELIHSVKKSGLADNQQIDETVFGEIKKNGDKYDKSNQIYLATGLFATQLNKDHANYFAEIAQNLTAHHFILTGEEELELIVAALHNLLDLLLVKFSI